MQNFHLYPYEGFVACCSPRKYSAGTLVPCLPSTDLFQFGYRSNDYNLKLLPSLGGITKCGLLASPPNPTTLKRDAIGPKVKYRFVSRLSSEYVNKVSGSLPSPGSGEKGHRFSVFAERFEKEWFSAFAGRLEGRAVLCRRKRLPLPEGWKEQRFSAGGRKETSSPRGISQKTAKSVYSKHFAAIRSMNGGSGERRRNGVFWQPESHFSWRKLEERALSLRGERVELEREKSLGEGVWRGFYTVAPASSHRSTSKSRFILREVFEEEDCFGVKRPGSLHSSGGRKRGQVLSSMGMLVMMAMKKVVFFFSNDGLVYMIWYEFRLAWFLDNIQFNSSATYGCGDIKGSIHRSRIFFNSSRLARVCNETIVQDCSGNIIT
ncbi:hypothetical protein M5K25_025216 [Dendrobium thyrsiflorum]|uniref:Uncharacterized protein n=1 Tax=Dendrobium thyrsiflorum TaxID=117978 RepID=A0ABD0U8H7_DENTH